MVWSHTIQPKQIHIPVDGAWEWRLKAKVRLWFMNLILLASKNFWYHWWPLLLETDIPRWNWSDKATRDKGNDVYLCVQSGVMDLYCLFVWKRLPTNSQRVNPNKVWLFHCLSFKRRWISLYDAHGYCTTTIKLE